MDELFSQFCEDEIFPKLVKYPGRSWCVVVTNPRQEKVAAASCAGEGIPTYLPLLTKLEIHNRGKRECKLPMFPRYFFACPTCEERTTIRCIKGVYTLLIVTDSEENILIGDLLKIRESELLSMQHKLVVNPSLQVGDIVRLKKGPFRHQDVIVVRREGVVRVFVNLNFLGRNIEVLCNADELEY